MEPDEYTKPNNSTRTPIRKEKESTIEVNIAYLNNFFEVMAASYHNRKPMSLTYTL